MVSMSSGVRLPLFVLLVLAACSGDPSQVGTAGRIDLFLDQDRVELLEGYEGYDGFVIEHDPAANPDRDAVALPLFRNGRFRWHVDAGPGRLLAGVARLGVGGQADDTSCELVVTAMLPGEPTRTEVQRWDVPALPADPDAPAAAWHEGPSLAIDMALPEGATSLEFQFITPLPVPDGSNVALLSPRVELETRPESGAAGEQVVEWATRLSTRAEVSTDTRPFSRLRLAEGVDEQHLYLIHGANGTEDDMVELPPVTPDGAFSGRDARSALTLLGGTTITLPLPPLSTGSKLRTALALDARLPPDTVARVILSIDSQEISRTLARSSAWVPIEKRLDDWAGSDRSLTVTVETVSLGELPVPSTLPDYEYSAFVPVEWFEPATVRVGLADLRVARDRTLTRRTEGEDNPSVVLIQVETLRGDLVGAVDGTGALIMPNLTALARAGEHHGMAMAPSPWTVPSTASLLTGLTPAAHGMTRHNRAFVPDAAETLAQRAQDAGVTTSAVVTNDLVRRHAGWDRGFETFAQVPYANARQVTDLALSLLDRHAGRQQLLYLHYWDPHGPYNAPGEWRDRFVEAGLRDRDYAAAEHRLAYDPHQVGPVAPDDPDARLLRQRYLGDVAYFDHWLGQLLEGLVARGRADTTTVMLTSDHGEEFFEHGMFGHGNQLYDESVHVPLVIARAGAWGEQWSRARAVGDTRRLTGDDRLVSTGGLTAEVLDELAMSYDEDELLPALSKTLELGHAVVATDKGISYLGKVDPYRRSLEAVRDGQHLLLIRKPVQEELGDDPAAPQPGPSGLDPGAQTWLFDLEADPEALDPKPAEGPAAEALRRRLEEWHAWSEEHALPLLTGGADLGALAKLGYVGLDDG
jgi:hypothetical protein